MEPFAKQPEIEIVPSAAASPDLVTPSLYKAATDAVEAASQEMIRGIENPKKRDRVMNAATEWKGHIEREGKSTKSPNNQEGGAKSTDDVFQLLEQTRKTLDSRYKNTQMWPWNRKSKKTLLSELASKVSDQVREDFIPAKLLSDYESRHNEFARKMKQATSRAAPALERELINLSAVLQSIHVILDPPLLIRPANQARRETEAGQGSRDGIEIAPVMGAFFEQGEPSQGTSRTQQVTERTAKYQQWMQELQQWRDQIDLHYIEILSENLNNHTLRYQELSRQAEQGLGLNDPTLYKKVEELWNEVRRVTAHAPERQEETASQITIVGKYKQLEEQIWPLFQEVSLAKLLNSYESRHNQFAQAMKQAPYRTARSLESELNDLSVELQSISIATYTQSLIKPANTGRVMGSFAEQGENSALPRGTSRTQQVAELAAKYQQWNHDIEQWREQIQQYNMQAGPRVRFRAGTSADL